MSADDETERLSVVVPSATKRALEQLARERAVREEQPITTSDLVRQAIENLLSPRRTRAVAEEPGTYRPRPRRSSRS